MTTLVAVMAAHLQVQLSLAGYAVVGPLLQQIHVLSELRDMFRTMLLTQRIASLIVEMDLEQGLRYEMTVTMMLQMDVQPPVQLNQVGFVTVVILHQQMSEDFVLLDFIMMMQQHLEIEFQNVVMA